MEMLDTYEWYNNLLNEADEKHPELKDVYCSLCGCRLVKGSVSWENGLHIDGCE